MYSFLWLLLLASLVFSPSQICTFFFLYIGLKCAVVDYLFYRYPRIREKYDKTSKLWSTLPTDAELEKQTEKARAENGCSSPDLNTFLEHFGLPASEMPLPGWHGGRRCTLVNRDRSLTSAFRNGRLYLTNSYLCFERSKTHMNKNLKVTLKDINQLIKANSYSWIPGGGMAIELALVGEGKGYFFGGIMNRDEVYDAICDAAKRAGATLKENIISQDVKELKDKDKSKDKDKEKEKDKEE